MSVVKPDIPADVEEWSMTEMLKKEKELIGMYLSAHPLDIHKFEIKQFTNYKLSELPELIDAAANSEALQRKAINIAGIVTGVQQSVAKSSGKPYLRFTLEDFSGTYQFPLFGKDYENFSKYIQPNHALLIYCNFSQRYQPQNDKRPDEFRLFIKSIHYLAHVREELVRNICINLSVAELTESFVERFADTVTQNKGNIELLIKLADNKKGMVVDLFSRKFRIALTPEFMDFMDTEQLAYRINVQ
jgi:DNA polymerase-3 subunit alpha